MKRLTIIEKMDYPEKSIEIERDRMVGVSQEGARIKSDLGLVLCGVRENDEFKHGAIWFNDQYDWEFGKDSAGANCAVPLEKK